MSNGSDFKHITLITPECEDEIIYAGVSKEGNGQTADLEIDCVDPTDERRAGENGLDDPVEVDAKYSLDVSEGIVGVEEPCERQLGGNAGASRAKKPKKSRDDEGFHETTLQDLEESKIPLTQKIVIIAAIVLIIVAVVYYFMVLR